MKRSSFNSTLSCIIKCIRIKITMINKKIIFGLFIVSLLGACASPTAMLGPAYTFSFKIGPLKAFVRIGRRVTIKAAIPVGIPFEIE